jgi:hypothetical protein
MTDHVSIQDPDDYSDEDMMAFAERLFSPLTPTEELERICMLLAHIPSKDAQHLLGRFRESARAGEVDWIECAAQEGAFHVLEPGNALEEREFLTIKVIEELEDQIVELSVRRDELDLEQRKLDVRYCAVKALVAARRLDPNEALGFDDGLLCLNNDIHELDERLEVEDAVVQHLRDSITTPRYRTADPSIVRHIHVD